ncbi:MAG: bifunctional enoyl-CoA hydratase/phosphate acetyltransferase [Anaerolineae bacterium]
MITKLDEIVEQARRFGPKRVAVAAAANALVLRSIKQAEELGLISPLLVGNREEILAEADAVGYRVSDDKIVHVAMKNETAPKAVELVRTGKADILMKGYLHTHVLLHAVLDANAGLRTDRLLSHVFLMQVPTYHKLLAVTDAAITIAPDLLQKAAIVQNAVDLMRSLGIDLPKVAALSSVETINPRIPSTIDAACLHKMAERGQINHAIVDGPFAFDNAISRQAALEKGIDSPVSGDADILLAPDLDAGNILSKNLEYLASAQMAGIVMGARVPIVLTSRSDPPGARTYSLALAVLLTQTPAPSE